MVKCIDDILALAESDTVKFCEKIKSNNLMNLADESGSTLLIYLAREGNYDAVTCLLDAGVEKDIVDDVGDSALHAALAGIKEGKSSLEVLKNLLQHECDTEVYGWLGQTPLHYAINLGLKECVELLLEHGANPHSIEKDALVGNNRNAFDIAASTKKKAIIKILSNVRTYNMR